MKRCQSLSPGGATKKGQLPKKGTQCGLEEGHDGLHTVLIPTGYPWFGSVKKEEPPPEADLLDRHPRPWTWHLYGANDDFIRDAKGEALFDIGHNSAARDEIAALILKLVNEL